jgi:iron complex transport system substrate-binding protein
VRIPRGRATVKIAAKFKAAMQSQETCPDAVAAFERPRKGVQAAGISLFRKRSRRQPAAFVWHRGDGILYFRYHKNTTADSTSLRNLCALCVSAVSLRARTFNAEKQSAPRKRRERSGLWLLLIAAFVIGLGSSCFNRLTQPTSSPVESREVTDEAGRRVRLPFKIDRIVSLAPNLTEIVFAVGAGDRLVGRTEYCDYPADAVKVEKVGDTMHPSIERIVALKPQIVLVSTASQLEAFTKQLDEQSIAVYVTNPRSLDEVFHSIETLGDLFGHRDGAASIVADLRRRAAAVEVATGSVKPIKIFYQVSNEPLYTIGRESYLTDMVRRAGGVSVTADVPTAFPRFSDEAALAARPEAIILPTGGSMGTANSTVATALKRSPAALNNRIYKINEDHLQRPGPRLVDGLEEMARALHPEVFK